MALDFDTSGWPLVVIAIDGSLCDRELCRLLEGLDTCLERGHHVLVMDLGANVGVDIRHLRRTASWLASRRPKLGNCPPTVFVFSSPFMRAAVAMVYKLSSEPGRYHVCEHRAEAVALAEKILGSDKIAKCA